MVASAKMIAYAYAYSGGGGLRGYQEVKEVVGRCGLNATAQIPRI